MTNNKTQQHTLPSCWDGSSKPKKERKENNKKLLEKKSCPKKVICFQETGCTRLLVGKLVHTGLVPFVDELGTVCGEVPLENEFEVLVWSEQRTVCFLMYNCVILSSAPGVFAGKHQWVITQSCVTLWGWSPLGLVPFVDYLPGFPYLVDWLLTVRTWVFLCACRWVCLWEKKKERERERERPRERERARTRERKKEVRERGVTCETNRMNGWK